MKKAIIGSLVGAIIIFIWQFVSFGLVNFHRSAQDYTEKQDVILSFLNNQELKEGGYILPGVPASATSNEREAAMKAMNGKPWAMIQYHNKAVTGPNTMTINMIRGFLVNVVIVLLFCWLMAKMTAPGFGTILTSALVVGMIGFLNQTYTGFIWYQYFDIWAYFFDVIVAWGLTGIWLGWWLRRGTKTVRMPVEKEMAMA